MQRGIMEYGSSYDHENDSTYEDFLVMNEKGLLYLRCKIDEVLAGQDTVTFDDELFDSEFIGIRRVEEFMQPEQNKVSGFLETLTGYSVVIAIIGTFICGIWKVWELLS